jgi:hypothetical protein
LYLVDSNRKIKTVKLPAHSGFNSNPLMQPSRNTILYLNDGALRVMAADGSGDHKLFDRDPGGCKRVHHAAWSQSDPKVILIACLVSETIRRRIWGIMSANLHVRVITCRSFAGSLSVLGRPMESGGLVPPIS